MEKDIVPGLQKAIKKSFQQNISKHKGIQGFLIAVKKDTAKMEEVSTYAADLGKCASDALKIHLQADNLPDGNLYWNIVQRTIKPLMKDVHTLVNAAAVDIQKKEDKKQRIGIKPIIPSFPEERIDKILNKLVIVSTESEEDE